MINITLPDGSVKQFEKGSTVNDVAMSISHGLARNVVSAKFIETIVETVTPLNIDGNLTLFTFDTSDGKNVGASKITNVDQQVGLTYLNNVKPFNNIFENDISGLTEWLIKTI